MTIMHHPSDMVLAEFANGTLDEASSLVVGAHVAQCSECQRTVRQCEALGGALIDSGAAPMLSGAEAVLARADEGPVDHGGDILVDLVPSAGGKSERIETLLGLYDSGRWRWVGPGVQYKPLSVPSREGIRVFMLKAKAGVSLPHHTHTGIEWTCVLEGAFRHALGRFGPGDFDEADDSVDHDPVVEKDSDCVCLVAMNGELQLQGFVGRLIQPFVRL